MGEATGREVWEAARLDIQGGGSETVWGLLVSGGKFVESHGKSSAGVAGYLCCGDGP